MGALIILTGIIFLDVFTISDIIRSKERNVLLYVLFVVALPLIGVSIWYIKRAIIHCNNKSS